MKNYHKILILLGVISLFTNVTYGTSDKVIVNTGQDKGLIHLLIKKIIPAKGKLPIKTHQIDSIQKPLEVFGWHPYWFNNLHPSYDIDNLTTLSYYGIEASFDEKSNKLTFNKNGWGTETSGIIKKVKQIGCRLEVTFVVRDNKTAKAILEKQKEACIDSLIRLVKNTNEIDGLTVLFHTNEIGDRIIFTDFIKHLYEKINPLKKEISVAIIGKSPEKYYQLKSLNPYVNRFIIRGYHSHDELSKSGLASSPEQSSSYLEGSMGHTIHLYEKEGIDKSKMILALPYYAAVWELNSKKEKHKFQEYIHYKEVIAMIKKHSLKINYDSITHSSCIYFSSEGKNYVCYFESEKSIQHKFNWVAEQGLVGIGIWALGYDQGQEELWNLIAKNINVVKEAPSTADKKPQTNDNSSVANANSPDKQAEGASNSIAKADKVTPLLPAANKDNGNDPSKKEPPVIEEATIIKELTQLIEHPVVMSVAIVLTLCYLVIGCVSSLFDAQVRDQLEITTILHYIALNAAVIVLFAFINVSLKYAITELDYLFEISAAEVGKYLVATWLFVFLIINILSYKLLIQNLGGRRLP